MPEDKTDWKQLHRFAQMRGFGIMGLMSIDVLNKYGKDGEKLLREFFIKIGQGSAKAFLAETKPGKEKSDFQNYCDWQMWFMSSQRADNSGSKIMDPVEVLAKDKDGNPTHVRAKRIGCMINNAWDMMGIKDITMRKKLCNIFTEIDYGVRDVIGKDCVEFVRFDCQSEREHGDPGLPQGKPYCIFEIKINR